MKVMISNSKIMIVIFISFVVISLGLLFLEILLPSVIIAFFGGMACLERGLRWYNLSSSWKSILAACFSIFIAISPFFILMLKYIGDSI
jgi:hypothetical protein